MQLDRWLRGAGEFCEVDFWRRIAYRSCIYLSIRTQEMKTASAGEAVSGILVGRE